MTTLWHQIDAPAKFNLCLQVLKKREDGYHELLSFAGFTRFGDRLSVCVQPQDKMEYEGPFADALVRAGGDSLCKKLCQGLREAGYDLPPLHIRLEKISRLAAGWGAAQQMLPPCFALSRIKYCRKPSQAKRF